MAIYSVLYTFRALLSKLNTIRVRSCYEYTPNKTNYVSAAVAGGGGAPIATTTHPPPSTSHTDTGINIHNLERAGDYERVVLYTPAIYTTYNVYKNIVYIFLVYSTLQPLQCIFDHFYIYMQGYLYNTIYNDWLCGVV